MPSRTYLFWCLAIIVGLVLSPLLFRFALIGLIEISGCRGTGGACGAVAVVIGMVLKPAITVGFAAILFFVTRKRLRWIMPKYWAILPSMLLLSLGSFLFFIGNFWGANFAAGLIVGPPVPYGVLPLAVVLILFSTNFENSARFTRGFYMVDSHYGRLYSYTSVFISVFVAIKIVFLLNYSIYRILSKFDFMFDLVLLANALFGVIVLLSLMQPSSDSNDRSNRSDRLRKPNRPMFGR